MEAATAKPLRASVGENEWVMVMVLVLVVVARRRGRRVVRSGMKGLGFR